MKTTIIRPLFIITLLMFFVACEKKNQEVLAPSASEAAPVASDAVDIIKDDLKEIAVKAEAKAKEVVETAKVAAAENIKIVKEKVAGIKAEAADEMAEVVLAAGEKLDEVGAAFKDVQKDAAQSLNNMLKPRDE